MGTMSPFFFSKKMIKKFRLLSKEDCKNLREKIENIEYEDGLKTAGSVAKAVKNNRQLTWNTQAARPILQALEARLMNTTSLFRLISYPRALNRTMINVHGPGEFYGKHVDNAWIINPDGSQLCSKNGRADLSFTLFLQEKDQYEGGELCIHHDLSTIDVKLDAGEMVVYDSGLLHQVKPVTKGVRIGFVGWVQSWIPDARMRAILTSFDMQIARMRKIKDVPKTEIDEFMRVYNELLRYYMR